MYQWHHRWSLVCRRVWSTKTLHTSSVHQWLVHKNCLRWNYMRWGSERAGRKTCWEAHRNQTHSKTTKRQGKVKHRSKVADGNRTTDRKSLYITRSNHRWPLLQCHIMSWSCRLPCMRIWSLAPGKPVRIRLSSCRMVAHIWDIVRMEMVVRCANRRSRRFRIQRNSIRC